MKIGALEGKAKWGVPVNIPLGTCYNKYKKSGT